MNKIKYMYISLLLDKTSHSRRFTERFCISCGCKIWNKWQFHSMMVCLFIVATWTHGGFFHIIRILQKLMGLMNSGGIVLKKEKEIQNTTHLVPVHKETSEIEKTGWEPRRKEKNRKFIYSFPWRWEMSYLWASQRCSLLRFVFTSYIYAELRFESVDITTFIWKNVANSFE